MTRIIQDSTASIAYNLIRQRRDTLPAGKLWQEYDNALRDLTPTTPDEHNITMAGGNGEPEKGTWITDEARKVAKIALNKALETEDSLTAKLRISSALKQFNLISNDPAPTPEPRTEDWKVSELFGENPAENLRSAGATCFECGALVTNLFDHVTWHNKLLP